MLKPVITAAAMLLFMIRCFSDDYARMLRRYVMFSAAIRFAIMIMLSLFDAIAAIRQRHATRAAAADGSTLWRAPLQACHTSHAPQFVATLLILLICYAIVDAAADSAVTPLRQLRHTARYSDFRCHLYSLRCLMLC